MENFDPNPRRRWGFQPGATLPPVIDTRVRPHVVKYLDAMGRGLVKVGMTPTAMTTLGLALVLLGSILIARQEFVLGGWTVAAGSMLDGLDGAVARASNKVTARGAFLDAAFDRVGEVAAWAALAFALEGQATSLLLIVVATGGALLVPYMRAKAESVGLPGQGGIMGRGERILLFCAGVIVGFIDVMLWIYVVTVWLTAFARFYQSYRSIE